MAKRHISLNKFHHWVEDINNKYSEAETEVMNVSTALVEDEWKYVLFIRDGDRDEFRCDIPMFEE